MEIIEPTREETIINIKKYRYYSNYSKCKPICEVDNNNSVIITNGKSAYELEDTSILYKSEIDKYKKDNHSSKLDNAKIEFQSLFFSFKEPVIDKEEFVGKIHCILSSRSSSYIFNKEELYYARKFFGEDVEFSLLDSKPMCYVYKEHVGYGYIYGQEINEESKERCGIIK